MRMLKDTAVMLMAYGAPSSLDDVEAYLTDIKHGVKPSDEELIALKKKYAAIGGISPIRTVTEKQALSLEHALSVEYGEDIRVFIGMKHAYPKIAESAKRLRAFGNIKEVIALALAPQYSSVSIPGYKEPLVSALEGHAKVDMIEKWYDVPGFAQMWASRISKCIADDGGKTFVIFTAHSLPKAAMSSGDPYESQLAETVESITRAGGIEKYDFAFQSGAGRNGWLGPDIASKIEEHKSECDSFAFVPIGYVSDNLEVLCDLDIETKEYCAKLGKGYLRPEMPNDSPELSEILAEACRPYIEKE